jgi:glycerol-3-phosphate acyltransferase PlsY
VGRALGRKFGGLVFVLDMLKGLLPTLAAGAILARSAAADGWSEPTRYIWWLAVGVACVLGHNYPIYLRFRGGKGVATSLGVTLGVYPDLTYPALIALGVWAVVVVISRYVSLGSICAGIALPVAFVSLSTLRSRSIVSESWPLLAFSLLLTAMVIIRHRSNVGRLLAGTESKIGRRSTGPPASAAS